MDDALPADDGVDAGLFDGVDDAPAEVDANGFEGLPAEDGTTDDLGGDLFGDEPTADDLFGDEELNKSSTTPDDLEALFD